MSYRKFMKTFAPALICAIVVGVPTAAADTTYPTKPVRMIVAFPPGQATDIVARMLGEELSKVWKRQVVIDNRAGGANIPGTLAGRDAPPDGYTLTFATSSSMAVNPSLYSNLPYDPKRDFAMVNGVFFSPWIIVAHPATPYSTLKEMVDVAKKNPGALTWGYGATALQLAAELFKFRVGVDIVGVPYKGSGPAITDLLGGQIPMLIDTMAATLPHIKAGKIKGLASLSAHRAPLLPELPTVIELGYPGVEGSGWGGLVVPKATPREIVEKIGADVRLILKDPGMQQRILERGAVVDARGPKEWTQFVNAEITKWAEIARRANVKAE